eukprot:6456502-Amphidinium_carterae.2
MLWGNFFDAWWEEKGTSEDPTKMHPTSQNVSAADRGGEALREKENRNREEQSAGLQRAAQTSSSSSSGHGSICTPCHPSAPRGHPKCFVVQSACQAV